MSRSTFSWHGFAISKGHNHARIFKCWYAGQTWNEVRTELRDIAIYNYVSVPSEAWQNATYNGQPIVAMTIQNGYTDYNIVIVTREE